MTKQWLAGSALLAVTLVPASAWAMHQDGDPGFTGRAATIRADLGPDNTQTKPSTGYVVAGDPDDGGQLHIALAGDPDDGGQLHIALARWEPPDTPVVRG